MYRLPENNLIDLYNCEPIDIWINSFGGCRSNYIRSILKDTFTTYNKGYEYKGCHYIKPLDVKVGSGLFCFVDDVGVALTSQLNRGNKLQNYDKLMPSTNTKPLTIGNWLDGIEQQIQNWTKPHSFPIVILNTDHLKEVQDEFESNYGVKLENYSKRSTEEYHPLVIEEIEKVEKINKVLKNLPYIAQI